MKKIIDAFGDMDDVRLVFAILKDTEDRTDSIVCRETGL